MCNIIVLLHLCYVTSMFFRTSFSLTHTYKHTLGVSVLLRNSLVREPLPAGIILVCIYVYVLVKNNIFFDVTLH